MPPKTPSNTPNTKPPYGRPDSIVAIASDHGGYRLKQALIPAIEALGLAVLDIGCHGLESVDYPDFADQMATVLASGQAARGVLICGTGIGISMAANRHPNLRVALCTNGTMARLAREHNDANVLALGERITGEELARDCLRIFLSTDFEGGRHARRVEKFSPSHKTEPA